ncbi:MAG: hypothetical protein QOJ64_4301 [Acidobacteriota bacterium]|jgi:hypothetical protein|nr:hypothetical protein [Acidobacteriota bacterium]
MLDVRYQFLVLTNIQHLASDIYVRTGAMISSPSTCSCPC